MDMSLSSLLKLVKDREANVLQSMGLQSVGHDWATELKLPEMFFSQIPTWLGYLVLSGLCWKVTSPGGLLLPSLAKITMPHKHSLTLLLCFFCMALYIDTWMCLWPVSPHENRSYMKAGTISKHCWHPGPQNGMWQSKYLNVYFIVFSRVFKLSL